MSITTPQPPMPPDAPAWSTGELTANPHSNPNKPEKVRRMFGAIAASYDLNNRLHSFGRDVAWRRRAVRLTGVRPTDDVLDVACGTGDLTRAFAASQPRRVVGLDFTPQMLDIACSKSGVRLGLRSGEAPEARRAAAPRRGELGGPTPEYLEGDATNLPFPDRSFDIVSIAFGLRNVGQPLRALREFRRVLRPGGRVVVLEFGRPHNRLIAWCNDLYTRRIMPVTATIISGDRSGAYRYLPASVESFMPPDELSAAITGAGFASVSYTPLTFGVCLCHVGRC